MHVLAALFMYALARELGRSRYAALLVGVAFGCSGYVGSTGWPQMIHAAIWIPLIFLLFHRVVKARSTGLALAQAVLCGGAIGLSLLSGHHQAPMYTLMALTVFLLVVVIRRASESKVQAGRLMGLYAVVAVAAFLLAALQLLPGYEYGQEAYRWVNTPEPVTMGEELPLYVHTDLRLMAVSLLGVFVPRVNLALSTFVGFVLPFPVRLRGGDLLEAAARPGLLCSCGGRTGLQHWAAFDRARLDLFAGPVCRQSAFAVARDLCVSVRGVSSGGVRVGPATRCRVEG